MQTTNLNRKTFVFIVLVIFFSPLFFSLLVSKPISAQNFSGKDCNNYSCPNWEDYTIAPGQNAGECPQGLYVDANDNFVCGYNDSQGRLVYRPAIPNPPRLRQLEVWFVRILYAIWALSGIFFTVILMWIGFIYLTSFGNEYAAAEAIKKFRNWMIGIALVFLSYPILNTFFNILPIDESQTCFEDINMPGFQFFFANACVTETLDARSQCHQDCEDTWSDPLDIQSCKLGCDT